MSKAWKGLEYKTAEILKGKRIIRQSYSDKKPDVEIEDFPSFKIDTKRYQRFKAFSLYEEVKKRYCEKLNDKTILVLRQSNTGTKLAVIDLKLLGHFLDFIREKKGQNEFN